MRLTVGPLPPAVYWRRRAVVLGALLLVLVVVYASCSGSGTGAERQNTAGKPSATPSANPAPSPTESLLTPETDEPADGGAVDDEPGPDEPDPTDAQPRAPGAGPCTDEEMTITPIPAKTTVRRGTPLDIRLTIKNASDRSCERDVGADLQELRLVNGAETVWSSDHCGPSRGSDVRTFAAGNARQYMVTWNGKSSSKCTSGVPTGAVPAAGQYQLLARLGTKHSNPVELTLTTS